MTTDAKARGFWRKLAWIWSAVTGRPRRQIWTVVMLTTVAAASETVTIGAVVPFLALLAGGSSPGQVGGFQRLLGGLAAGNRSSELALAAVVLGLAAAASGLLKGLLVRKSQDLAADFGHQVSVDVQRRMLAQPYSWHVRHNSSEQLAFIEKAELLAAAVLLPLVQAFSAAVLVAVVMIVLVVITPFATFVAGLSIGGAYLLMGALARRRLDIYAETISKAFAERIRIVQEAVGGIRDLILDSSQSRVMDSFRRVDQELARARADASVTASLPRFLIEPFCIIVIAGLAVLLSGRQGGIVAALPVLGAFTLGAQRLLPLSQQLYNGWTSVAANRFLIDDVVEQLLLPLPSPVGAARLPFKQSIALRGVSYAYPGRAGTVLEGLSFDIRRGSRVALIGRTGSGKTTAADLLMGLLEPSAGDILIDGVSLTDLTRPQWRANVAHVPQMLFVADATVAENIAMGTEVQMQRIREATSYAQLEEFIASLPNGLETRVGERGAQISGGQRQRLAIARAIYKDAPFLVFDEATNSLDAATERAVFGALDRLHGRGLTIVIISHREAAIEGCDHVLRLDEGRLVENRPLP